MANAISRLAMQILIVGTDRAAILESVKLSAHAVHAPVVVPKVKFVFAVTNTPGFVCHVPRLAAVAGAGAVAVPPPVIILKAESAA